MDKDQERIKKEGKVKNPPRGKGFMIVCNQMADDGNPLMTEVSINEAIAELRPMMWAWILHDKDSYNEGDEFLDPEHKAGSPKKPHYHIVLQFDERVTVGKVAKAFGIPDNFVDKAKDVRRISGMFLYLIHRRDPDKYQYEPSEVKSNFDYTSALEHWIKELSLSLIEDVLEEVYKGKATRRSVIRDYGYSFYNKYKTRIDTARADFLRDCPTPPFRVNFYVEGKGGIGKSTICRWLASMYAPIEDVEQGTAYFEVKGDIRVAFEGYDGQRVIIWDDQRAEDFIRAFGRGNTLNIFDTHPGEMSLRQNVKYGTTYLANAVNIVNGSQSYSEFLDRMAGEYVDNHSIKHEAEDKNQSYRRFPAILCLHEEDFDILLNKGYFENSRDFLQFFQYTNVVGNFGQLQKLISEAKTTEAKAVLEDAKSRMLAPVHEVKEMIDEVEKGGDASLFEEAETATKVANFGTCSEKKKPRRKKKEGNA